MVHVSAVGAGSDGPTEFSRTKAAVEQVQVASDASVAAVDKFDRLVDVFLERVRTA